MVTTINSRITLREHLNPTFYFDSFDRNLANMAKF